MKLWDWSMTQLALYVHLAMTQVNEQGACP